MFRLGRSTFSASLLGLVVCAMLVASIKPGGGEASSALLQAISTATTRATPSATSRVTPSLARRAPLAVAPSLGAAASFAVLGATAVSNTGPTVLNGDLGISPNNASSITGFPPGLVTGVTHAADAVALQAQADTTTAYNALTSQACDFGPFAPTDLGGQTLTPGVYCYSSTVGLTGALTLNGQGNSNSVWIFRIGSALTTASSSSVLLINSASACNVFWQVGSSATLGTTTAFRGNILALSSITLNTGATMIGRALARTAAVTLDTNTVSFSGCAAPAGSTNTPQPNSATQTAVAATLTAISASQTAVLSVPQTATAAAQQTATAAALQTAIANPNRQPAEVPESGSLVLLGGGLGGLATWLGWQWRQVRERRKQ